MNDKPSGNSPQEGRFAGKIGGKVAQKLKAKRHHRGVWSGLGMMGLVGWTISAPTLLGAAVGAWLDARHPGGHPWTLALLVAGLVLGCLGAWRWVAKEDRAMHDESEEDRG